MGLAGEPAGSVTVRPAGTADWGAVRDLCCLTANAGNPIERPRWPFFAELWIGPYQRIVPEWTYVAEVAGQVVGYLTGCPDTVAFRRARPLRCTAPLLLRVAAGRFGWGSDPRRFVRRTLRREQGPEERLLARLPAGFLVDYPAHLHVNAAAGWRGRVVGRRLIERYVGDLRARRVRGVHLFCGAAARGFYLRLGFEELGSLPLRSGAGIHALGRRL